MADMKSQGGGASRGYTPTPETAKLLERALSYAQSVSYPVTARWVFYRLLQDGTLQTKADYKRLLGHLSHARKEFSAGWRPDTLVDDTRAPILLQRRGYYGLHFRGGGFANESEWFGHLRDELNCPLDRWKGQKRYVEIWFEAAAMQGQFLAYANPNIPLLAFHGDISIPEKWRSASRLVRRWKELGRPEVVLLYYGDLDAKGEQIPETARKDVRQFGVDSIFLDQGGRGSWKETAREFLTAFTFRRVGINPEHVARYGIPENPERPGTYQWEGLNDTGARALISETSQYLDLIAFSRVEETERGVLGRLKLRLEKGAKK